MKKKEHDSPGARHLSGAKHDAMLSAATGLFLKNGYQGTNMEDVATAAGVSKQTVYKHFADKEGLFTEIISGVTDNSEAVLDVMQAALNSTDDMVDALTALGRSYIVGVMQPSVVRLRRLIIAEAERFPELAELYFLGAPTRAIALLAGALHEYRERDLLVMDDALVAAHHFAYLVLSIPLDRAMFFPTDFNSKEELHAYADAGVATFLAAYRPAGRSRAGTIS